MWKKKTADKSTGEIEVARKIKKERKKKKKKCNDNCEENVNRNAITRKVNEVRE